jgi:hypothetical protein
MKINLIGFLGIFFVALALATLVAIATQQTFPEFKYSTDSNRFVSTSQNIGLEDSRFIWNENGLNLIAQAFVLFAAASATIAILSHDAEEQTE